MSENNSPSHLQSNVTRKLPNTESGNSVPGRWKSNMPRCDEFNSAADGCEQFVAGSSTDRVTRLVSLPEARFAGPGIRLGGDAWRRPKSSNVFILNLDEPIVPFHLC